MLKTRVRLQHSVYDYNSTELRQCKYSEIIADL